MRAAAILLLVTGLAGGCGQRGELYLRDSPPPGMKPAKSEAAKPIPAPQTADDGSEKKR
jgi:predicted small lipoprotein YifL